jgi:hypothetical protein
MNRIYWKAICQGERIEAISRISDIINRYGAIVNFQKFSDVILSMVVETTGDQVDALYQNLSRAVTLEACKPDNLVVRGDIIILLQVTFAQSTGELVIETHDMPE